MLELLLMILYLARKQHVSSVNRKGLFNMPERINAPQVGAPDPELQNSPIAQETDEEYEVLRQEQPGEPECYFNDASYPPHAHVCSGDALLRCDYGIWVRVGSCDPDNP